MDSLTPEVRARLIEASGAGLPYVLQAMCAGIGDRTYRRWRSRARAGEQPYADLMRDVHVAEGRNALDIKRLITTVALGEKDEEGNVIRQPNWLAAAWYLERRYPREYSTVAALRQADDEEEQATSAESRKRGLLQAFKATRSEDPA
ncbi:MAG: hypothetical protein HRU14_18315 [Planctomycetes bacterium]|nr:hypothetical protein [Planctomycetota bacterium]